MNILITGGASGIGASITENLCKKSEDKVFFTFNKSYDAALNIEKKYSNAKGINCDFSKTEDIEKLLTLIPEYNIDILINNAITGLYEKHFHKMDSSLFLENFQKNILPTIKITQTSITLFRKKKFGKIITILSSYLVNRPPIGLSEYVASKAYLESLSKSWAIENASFNITSNCVSPSLVQTHLTSNIDSRIIEQMESHHPLKKLLTPNEIADSVSFLVGSTQHINGINLIINGGSDVI